MDGENNGKPYEQMDDLEEKPTIFGSTSISPYFRGPIASLLTHRDVYPCTRVRAMSWA